jgi:phospholipid/cholesterol/gamma-HCH transport system permease protein
MVPLVRLYHGYEPPRSTGRPRRERAVVRLGASIAGALQRARGLITFWGSLVEALGALARAPKGVGAISPLIARTGSDGIPIVLFLNFLVGLVMAIQTTPLLKIYGAGIYVADIVGVSVTRELAPLMTAIIISGRSGAAFAAELGTMRVSEEIDALRTMGFPPVTYLVLPRVIALTLVAPALTLLGDVMGIVGGLVVAAYNLELHPRGYLAELRTVLVPADVWTGLIKSGVFGAAIALIGCQQGLSTQGAASGVGRGTTATVVYCLFTIVILDTLFTMLFRELAV